MRPGSNAPPQSYAPHLVLLLLMTIWGGSYAVVKVSLESLSPFLVVAIRFWLGTLCLAVCLGRSAGADLRKTRRPGLLTGVALGVGFLLQTCGLQETSASMGGFLAGLIVLLVALGGWLLFQARFGTQSIVGLVLGLCGLLLLCWPTGTQEVVANTPRGILLQIGSSTSFACHILMLSFFGRGAPAIAYCFWQLLLVALLATTAALVDGGLTLAELTRIEVTPPLVAYMLYLGVLATGVSIAIQSKIQHRIPPTHLALLFALQPLFAALIGWAWLGDRMGPLELLGGATIVAGVTFTSLDRDKRTRRTGTPREASLGQDR